MDLVISFATNPYLWAIIIAVFVLKGSIHFVPQGKAYVVTNMGQYARTLAPGLGFTIPIIESVNAKRTMMEQALSAQPQDAITKDNTTVTLSGVLYMKVIDAEKATFAVDGYKFAATNLAMTNLRAAIGSMELDDCFQKRDEINAKVAEGMIEACQPWGVQVIRYEIKDLNPSRSIMDDMEKQMQAERTKRAAILDSEGRKEAAINDAEGDKQARIKAAEAEKAEQELKAEGEANAIMTVANATAEALEKVGAAASTTEGNNAVRFDLAKRAIAAQEALASKSNVLMTTGASIDSVSETVAKSIAVSNALKQETTS